VVFRRLRVSGWYNHGSEIIAINASHDDAFGTFCHEWGHRLHNVEMSRVDGVIRSAFARIVTPSCGICAVSPAEFFAETVYAYLCRRDELARVDAIGLECVRNVFRIVGIE